MTFPEPFELVSQLVGLFFCEFQIAFHCFQLHPHRLGLGSSIREVGFRHYLSIRLVLILLAVFLLLLLAASAIRRLR